MGTNITIQGRQFYNDTSPYQERYEELFDKIPQLSKSVKDEHLEMIRLYTIIYYELHDNGYLDASYWEDLEKLIKLTNKYCIKNTVLCVLRKLNELRVDLETDNISMYENFADKDNKQCLALEQLGVDIVLMTPPPLPKNPPKRLMKN